VYVRASVRALAHVVRMCVCVCVRVCAQVRDNQEVGCTWVLVCSVWMLVFNVFVSVRVRVFDYVCVCVCLCERCYQQIVCFVCIVAQLPVKGRFAADVPKDVLFGGTRQRAGERW